jgi:hypothetical protein
MKLTKTFYYQFGSQFTPDSLIPYNNPPPADFPAPSGIYDPFLSVDELYGTTIARIPINIHFKVRTIHIKNITYTRGCASNQGTLGLTPLTSLYINILSSLVGNRPVGMVFADSAYSMMTKQDIKHTFQIPQIINGIYDFSLYQNNGDIFYPFQESANIGLVEWYYWFDSFSITIEFNSEYEM